jgi:type VI secretion system protein ImpE
MTHPGVGALTALAFVQFVWTNGGQASGHIPTRYIGSESSPDGSLRLARKTDWKDLGEETFIGEGQRQLATDDGEYPVLQCRLIDFATAEGPVGKTGAKVGL